MHGIWLVVTNNNNNNVMMKLSSACLLLGIYVSGADGFMGIASSRTLVSVAASPMDGGSAMEASQQECGPDWNPGRNCPCCMNSDLSLSPRKARIEIPLNLLLASASLACQPAFAEDDVETIAEVDSEAKLIVPANEEKLSHEETSKTEVNASESKPTPPETEMTTDESKPTPPPETEVSADESKLSPKVEQDPKPKTFQEAMQKYFREAKPISVVASKVQSSLSQRKFTRSNTLLGTCVCPDEINSKPLQSLPAALQNAMTDLNGVYHLGGLAGLPYMGASGTRAFLNHAPFNGKVLILYGPHVGVTDEGIVGRVERLGKTTTLDCDATLNALMMAKSRTTNAFIDKEESTPSETADNREEFIVAKLTSALDKVETKLTNEELPAFATCKMFGLIREQLMKQLEASLKDDGARLEIDEIVLLGGIIINRGQQTGSIELREDYFEPIVFESYSDLRNSGGLGEATDLFRPVFGAKPTPFYAR